MNKETRKALRASIIDRLTDDMLPITIAGHTITDEYVYAGCSQWTGCGRDWDTSRHAWAWIVDGQYQLTYPSLNYFDGHNQIERQTGYYRQGDRAEEAPSEPRGEPLAQVPDATLLEIGRGLEAAIKAHESAQRTQEDEARRLLGGGGLPCDVIITITVNDEAQARAAVDSMIQWERDERARCKAAGQIGSAMADHLSVVRRSLQERAGLVLTHDQVGALVSAS